MYARCFLPLSLLQLVFLAFFCSLSLRIKWSDPSSESDESDRAGLEELEEDTEEELEEDGSESGFGLGTVWRQGRTSSSSLCCGVVNVAK